MEAGTSQLATATQELTQTLAKKGRKPKHKAGKGKQRETTSNLSTATTVNSSSNAAQNKITTGNDASMWPWLSLGDTSVSSQPPIFTKDYRYFFSIAGASVKIYATSTGQVVSTISSSTSGGASSSQHPDSHTSNITAALISPQNPFQLITASSDGRLKIWDFLEASLLRTIEIGQPITHMCAHESMRNHVFVAITSQKKHKREAPRKAEHSSVLRISLSPTVSSARLSVQKSTDVQKVGRIKTAAGLSVSPSGAWLVAIGGPKAYVCPTATLSSGFTKFVSDEVLTCLAFHPTEEYFATGDQKGQIRLWYCLNDEQSTQVREERRAQTTLLHWHAHAVSSVAFTPNGSYLLSGGEEAVLVIWQLHTGRREFVPRVGAPIVGVTISSPQAMDEEYLLVLSDGSLVFIGAGTLRISRIVARIKSDPNFHSLDHAPLAAHFRTSTIILPSSHPSSLLIYSPLTYTLLAELEVSPSNRVSRRDEKPIEPLRVDRVAVSDSGEWLATVDRREGGEDFEREIYMKIWQWDSQTSSWNLNSRIDRPHGVHNINALTFCSSDGQPLLISAGGDGNVKVWRTRSVSNKGTLEVFWVCRSTLGYRSQIPSDAVCSPDGSLLAVAFSTHAIVFELSNNVLRLALTCPEIKEVSHVAFIGTGGRYIAVTGRRDVVLWDLITSSVAWHHSSSQIPCHVVPHPTNDAFAIIYRSNRARPTLVRTFNVTSSSPITSPTLPFSLRSVVWYPFIPSSGSFTLLGVTNSWNTVVFGDRIDIPPQEGSSAMGILTDPNPHRRNIFEDIFGTSAFRDFSMQASPPVPAVEDVVAGNSKEKNQLDAPAYLLPPLNTLFTPLVEGLLQSRSTESPREVLEELEVEAEDEDIIMAEPPVTSGLGRTLRDGEVEEFAELFQQQIFFPGQSSSSPQRAVHINGNGRVAVNGVNHDKSTTIPSAAHTPTFVNGKKHPSSTPVTTVEKVPNSSPTVVGKKRKKSMG